MIKKWAKVLNRNFSKENIYVANKNMKRCSISLIIREMHIKTTMRHHLMLVRIAAIKKQVNNVSARMWRNWNPYALFRMSDSAPFLKNIMEVPQNIKNWIALWSSNSPYENTPKRIESRFWKDICALMFIAILFTIAKRWK